MKKKVVFAGSFDPFTQGHEDIARRALTLFDELIIAIGVNSRKTGYFSLDSRKKHIAGLFPEESRIRVESYSGLTTDFCKKNGAGYLIRGIRNGQDAEYEKSIAQMNAKLSGIESVFLMTSPEHSAIHSAIVREICMNGGDISKFVTSPEMLIINKNH